MRLLDAYINLSGHHTISWEELNKLGPINIPASRFLRPYMKPLAIIDNLRVRRIAKGMTHAAKHNHIFHLWWHPHNFGSDIDKNLAGLNKILTHFKYLQKTYGMRSLNMIEVKNEARRIQDNMGNT